jgi:hypothetical protein
LNNTAREIPNMQRNLKRSEMVVNLILRYEKNGIIYDSMYKM